MPLNLLKLLRLLSFHNRRTTSPQILLCVIPLFFIAQKAAYVRALEKLTAVFEKLSWPPFYFISFVTVNRVF